MAVGKACMAIFGPAPGLKGRSCEGFGFSTEETLLHCGCMVGKLCPF